MICLASALDPAYEIVTVLPVWAVNCAATSSSAFFREAAAKTLTSSAQAGAVVRVRA